MRMLLVDNDAEVGRGLVSALTARGFAVDWLTSGVDVLDRLHDVDVVLLERHMPDVDGLTLCRRIRAVSDVAIIAMSALDEVSDRILALHAGADDYLAKPCDIGELAARMYAVLRRGVGTRALTASGVDVIAVGDVEIRLGRQEVTVRGQSVPLSRPEYMLLALVVVADGAVCTRERLLAEICGAAAAVDFDMLRKYVDSIQRALQRPWLLDAVGDIGYRLGRPPTSRSRR